MTPEVTRAARVLSDGGVVAAATESFFGLLADASSPVALDRLFSVKPRSAGSALMIPGLAAWSTWVTEIPDVARRLAERFWPGPLTIALPAAAGVDGRLVVDGTVGVRMAGPSAATEICASFDGALTATSANLHGEPPTTRSEEVTTAFASACRAGRLYVVRGHCPGGRPSTIVSVRGDTVVVVRSGAVTSRDIAAATGITL